jgi:diaminopropionate ammonia-lyase
MCRYSFNPFQKDAPDWSGANFNFLQTKDMLQFHASLDGYQATPLLQLTDLAHSLGVGDVYVKDESKRFGIKAFKALGASYAMYRVLKAKWQEKFQSELTPSMFQKPELIADLGDMTFCAATDGNHGKAVAWTARMLNQSAVIYMPADSASPRIHNIKSEGADVVLVNGTFDDCVELCDHDACENNWQTISDTAYPGYMDVPKYILLGYTTLFREIEFEISQTKTTPFDFVFLPAGVGGLAAAGTNYFVQKYGDRRPTLVCIEPLASDCFLESIIHGAGKPLPSRGDQTSIMAGLNCGIPSPVAWPIVRDGMELFLGISDKYIPSAMRLYLENGVISGESGASGLAGLLALLKSDALNKAKEQVHLNEHSRILLINTEGDTDPVNYEKIITGEP